jgi:D-lactate dehydrogenase
LDQPKHLIKLLQTIFRELNMRVAVFSTQRYDKTSLERSNEKFQHTLVYFETPLTTATAALASGFPAVCVFVNDHLDAAVLSQFAKSGTELVALRCAGFNNVDLKAAKLYGITVLRVPAYSPYAVAEYTIGILLALDRKICRAWLRVREDNFDLNGLLGRDIHGKTVGIIGTGRIGGLVATTFKLGFGCDVLGNDLYPSQDLKNIGVRYVERSELIRQSDIICLHSPLTPETRHLFNAEAFAIAKPGLMLVNTGRGALIDTKAMIDSLEDGKLAGCAMDVYEREGELFFQDLSNEIVKDDIFQRLITMPNVLITGHQAFFTQEALAAITKTTLQNVADFERGHVDPTKVVD